MQGKITDPKPYPPGQVVTSVWKGPVFVNPYNSDELYVLTESGVKYSNDAGATFSTDSRLTQLITGNNAYPLTPGFTGGDRSGVRIANRSDRNQMGALADMAFLRDDPTLVVSVSPFTGLFYKKSGHWRDLSSYLMKPLTPISSVAIDSSTIYFATEGRGVFRLIGYRNG